MIANIKIVHCNGIRNGRKHNLPKKNLIHKTKIRTTFMFKTRQNLQHRAKEAVSCFLHLTVLTLKWYPQPTDVSEGANKK